MIYLASDHKGYKLKEKIKEWLSEWKYPFVDEGPSSFDPTDDYPDFVFKAAAAVSQSPTDKAIVLGHSGQGEAIVANKFDHVRAIVYYGPSSAKVSGGKPVDDIIKLSREHNNANVLSLGASFMSEVLAKKIVKAWLDTPFSEDERHVRRLKEIENIEKTGKSNHV